ncbi:unnamed protein product [Echinostoma caproni]|uniref:Uncharacterized protein n=1 Tax=Echinostoma caproni TaxID=27848 RepID=A0A3P8INJ7_9TREM|nr:unnamed protein product [Echinostoma caproni]
MESIFTVHNGLSLKAPLLVPVGVRDDITASTSRLAHQIRSTLRRQPKESTKSVHPRPIDQVLMEERENAVAHGPVMLEMRHGTPVYLPESLNLAFARYLARAGSSLIQEVEFGLKRYQFDRVYGNGNLVLDVELANTSYIHSVVELLQILREILLGSPEFEKCHFFVYLNHTDLTEAIFSNVGIPADACVTLWDKLAKANAEISLNAQSTTAYHFYADSTTAGVRTRSIPVVRHLALPAVLSASGYTRALPLQHRLISLLRLDVGDQVDKLRDAILQCAPRTQALIARRVNEAIEQLRSVLDIYKKLGESDRFNLRLFCLYPLYNAQLSVTPGLVLPCHLYQGIVFQLVACVPQRASKTKHGQSGSMSSGAGGTGNGVALGAGAGGGGGDGAFAARKPENKNNKVINEREDSRRYAGSRRYTTTTFTVTSLVLAQGGDYTHLVLKDCLPREYGTLRLPNRFPRVQYATQAERIVFDPTQGIPSLTVDRCPHVVGLTLRTERLVQLHFMMASSLTGLSNQLHSSGGVSPYPA